jgi:DNA-binding MarR family transcriptional regulator
MTQVYDAYLAPAGLTLTQYSLLANLVRRDPPQIHELGRVMGMDRTTVSRNLRPLLDRGLLSVGAGPDRRSRIVHVTGAGRALFDQAERLWRAAQDEIRVRLGDSNVGELHRLLDLSFDKLERP